ncbi:MAG TPA: hypothetical protein VLX91_12035 [Candidatus Acidoferrales bacterium]|nr:hypothetical protein [Candidatus Acidoferrales bacterium]
MGAINESYWETFVAIMAAFAFLALLIERALYQVFDSRIWKWVEAYLDRQTGLDYFDLKPWISAAVSIAIVFQFNLDMVRTIFNSTESHPLSMIITGLFVSGGSTGVYKFFKRARQVKDAMAEQKMTLVKTNKRSLAQKRENET